MIAGTLTLAMLKMEKNFVAHNEKGYSRRPYDDFAVAFFLERLQEELDELKEAYDMNVAPYTLSPEFTAATALLSPTAPEYYKEKLLEGIKKMKSECADVSNLVDFLYEKLCALEGMK